MIGLMLLDIWQALWCLPFFFSFHCEDRRMCYFGKIRFGQKKEPAKGGEKTDSFVLLYD